MNRNYRLLFLVFCSVFIIYPKSSLAYQSGLIARDATELKNTPSDSGNTISRLKAGTKVNLSDSPNNGYYKAATGHSTGWVRVSAVSISNNKNQKFATGNSNKRRSIASEDSSASPDSGDFNNSWYLRLAVGYSFPSYSSTTAAEITLLKSLSSSYTTNLPLSFDASLYLPLFNHKLLLGFASRGVFDGYSVTNISFNIMQLGFALSAIKSFGSTPHTGLYARADLGLNDAIATIISAGSPSISAAKYGFLALASVGYDFPFFKGNRFSLSTDYMISSFSDGSFSVLSLMLGFVF